MNKKWRDNEVEYLEEKAGHVKTSTIASNLGKTCIAVELKMKRLNLHNTKSQIGLLTMGALARIIRVDRNIVKGWVENHSLLYEKRITKEKRSFYFISVIDFWDWAEENKDKVQFQNIEYQVLIPEPLWVQEERRKEKFEGVLKKRKYQPWTTLADQQLIKLREKGLTYKKIGEIMDRSHISIERRYKRIRTV